MSDVTRYDRWERGECVDCGTPIGTSDEHRCAACASSHWEQEKARRDKLRKEGKCRCGKDLALGLAVCFKCRFGVALEEVVDWVSLAYGKSELSRRPHARRSYQWWFRKRH